MYRPWKYIEVADHERAFLFQRRRLVQVLGPGDYRLSDPFGRLSFTLFDISRRELNHPLGKLLLTTHAALIAPHLAAYQLGDHEVGLVFQGANLIDLIPPGGVRLYWLAPEPVRVETIDISEQLQVPPQWLVQLRALPAATCVLTSAEVEAHQVGLLYVNGELRDQLAPGSYGFWSARQRVAVRVVDTRWQTMEVNGQEILTRDRVGLRLNLLAIYRIDDVVAAVQQVASVADLLYRELQLELREAVATRTLDELLADKDSLDQGIQAGVVRRLAGMGVVVRSVGVRDVILPGEMRGILNQVVEAEKAAEANLIRRREETAATRSLHNTAKMMEGNPTLMRLKELEVLERVTERIGQLTVHSGLEGVLKDLVRLPSLP